MFRWRFHPYAPLPLIILFISFSLSPTPLWPNDGNHDKVELVIRMTGTGVVCSERDVCCELVERMKSSQQSVDAKVHVFKFVLTGGPCSGKTTAFQIIKSYLEGYDYRVYMVPEAATMLFINGVSFDDLNYPERQYAMQQSVLSIQTHVEKAFENVARSTGHKCVLLCDRGGMDGSAYMDRDRYCDIVRETGTDIPMIRDARYDGVMHLVSAADGAEQYYTLENNLARSETLLFAQQVDVANQHAWSGHPHHFIFDNSHPSFQHKLDALVSRIAGELGLPHPRQDSEVNPPTISYTLEEFPSEDSFPPDCKARVQTLTYLRTTVSPEYEFPPHPRGTESPYIRMGLHQSSSAEVEGETGPLETITDKEDVNLNNGIDYVLERDTGITLKRRVVARYVCKRTPVPLRRTTAPPPPTTVHPAVPPPAKEFPLSVYPNTDPLPTYEMTLIRKLEAGHDPRGDKFYKVHMTITEEDYEYLIRSQRDETRREVHQRRYYFINGRQPVIVIKNEDPWLLDLSAAASAVTSSQSCPALSSLADPSPAPAPPAASPSPTASASSVPTLSPSLSSNDLTVQKTRNLQQMSSTRLTPAWVKVCTEGSTLHPLPSFLNVGETIKSNSMEYTISIAAGLAETEAAEERES